MRARPHGGGGRGFVSRPFPIAQHPLLDSVPCPATAWSATPYNGQHMPGPLVGSVLDKGYPSSPSRARRGADVPAMARVQSSRQSLNEKSPAGAGRGSWPVRRRQCVTQPACAPPRARRQSRPADHPSRPADRAGLAWPSPAWAWWFRSRLAGRQDRAVVPTASRRRRVP